MTKQLSFSKYEQKILPAFRQKISQAESAEDVKKFFVYTIMTLFENIFAEKIKFDYEDIAFVPDDDPPYKLNQRLFTAEDFISVWNDSDLPHMVNRLAVSVLHRYRHLEKHPEKTDAKIRAPE